MKANELRIGNLFKTDEIVFVYSIEFNDKKREHRVYVDNLNRNYKDALFLDEINAIPLTEEWLAKFGVKWIDETGYGWIDGNYHFKAKKFKNGRIDIWINSNLVNNRKTKYVHQLQNLYFALTGEELKNQLR